MLTYDEPHVLSVTHYSPMMGQPDEPENYHTLVYTLTAAGDRTHLDLTQDGSDSQEQADTVQPELAGNAGRPQGTRRGLNHRRLETSRATGGVSAVCSNALLGFGFVREVWEFGRRLVRHGGVDE